MQHDVFSLNGNPNTTLTIYLTNSYGLVHEKPMVIVCPGGGFLDCSPNEGEPVALHFLSTGYHAAVLTYSNQTTAPGIAAMPQALFDLAAAIRLVREHAGEWGVAIDQIALLGFSAGAMLCSLYGNRWNEEFLSGYGTPEQLKPNAALLAYPPLETICADSNTSINMQDVLSNDTRTVRMQRFIESINTALYGHTQPTKEEEQAVSPIRYIGPQTPPTYIWQTFTDEIVSPLQSLHYSEALYKAGISCELHIFDKGSHGISLADRTCAKKENGVDPHTAHWAKLAAEWMDRQFCIRAQRVPL